VWTSPGKGVPSSSISLVSSLIVDMMRATGDYTCQRDDEVLKSDVELKSFTFL